MIIAIIILTWLFVNTIGTLIIICTDGVAPTEVDDWIGILFSCILSPVVILFIIKPITIYIDKTKRKKKRK